MIWISPVKMAYTIRRTTEVETIIEQHKIFFPSDELPKCDEKSNYWIVKENNKIIGFSVGRVIDNGESLFLARTGIRKAHRERGLHRRCIRIRERFARKQQCKYIITYVSMDNPKSFVNLIKQGYEVYTPSWKYAGKNFMYFRKVSKSE